MCPFHIYIYLPQIGSLVLAAEMRAKSDYGTELISYNHCISDIVPYTVHVFKRTLYMY